MLSGKLYASLLLLGTQSFVLANPLPTADEDAQLDSLLGDFRAEGLEMYSGDPEVITAPVQARSEDYELEAREESKHRHRARTDDQTGSLKLHNSFRAKKNIPALSWDATLAKNAQDWANYLAANNLFQHSTSDQRPNQGENLAFASSSAPIPNPMTMGTQLWLDEYKNYHNEAIPDGDFSSYGHYTQCMWNTTTKFGIATASNGKGGWYTVGRYSPPGNWYGQRPY